MTTLQALAAFLGCPVSVELGREWRELSQADRDEIRGDLVAKGFDIEIPPAKAA